MKEIDFKELKNTLETGETLRFTHHYGRGSVNKQINGTFKGEYWLSLSPSNLYVSKQFKQVQDRLEKMNIEFDE